MKISQKIAIAGLNGTGVGTFFIALYGTGLENPGQFAIPVFIFVFTAILWRQAIKDDVQAIEDKWSKADG